MLDLLTPRSQQRCCNHMISAVVFATTLNSASDDERVNIDCFLDDLNVRLYPRKIK